jgi:hypothetical protein
MNASLFNKEKKCFERERRAAKKPKKKREFIE